MTLPVPRPADAKDAPGILAVVESAYRGTGGRSGWTTEEHLVGGTRSTLEQITAMIADHATDLLVLEERGRVLGCCAVHPPEEGGEITEFGLFAVDPALQGAGIGGFLLDAAEHRARERGEELLEIRVLQSRPELRQWYERRGYAPTGEVRPFPGRAEDLKVADLGMDVLVKALA